MKIKSNANIFGVFIIFFIILMISHPVYAETITTQDIVYSCNNNLCVMNSDGSNNIKITEDGNSHNIYSYPSWSHDGKSIAYLIRKYTEDLSSDRYGIGILDVGTLIKRDLLFSDQLNYRNFIGGPIYSKPSWSPDDNKIMFTASGFITNLILGDEALRSDRLYTINKGGSELNLIFSSTDSGWDAFLKQYIFRNLFHLRNADWNPKNSSMMVFDKRFHFQDNYEHLWVSDINGENQQQITFGERETYPQWSCDGNYIFYESGNSLMKFNPTNNVGGLLYSGISGRDFVAIKTTIQGDEIIFTKSTRNVTDESGVFREQRVDGTYNTNITYERQISSDTLISPDWKVNCY